MKRTISFLLTLLMSGVAMAQMAVPDRMIVQHRLGADGASACVAAQSYHDALRISVLRVDPAKRDQIQKDLEQTGLFDFVEPDSLARVLTTPNDPGFASQWHLATIQAPSAWGILTGSTNVTVGMVDSGVDTTHPDLAGKIVGGWNFVSNNSTIVDTMGHGTVAATGNNGVGVSGVVWQNPIMPLIVVDSTRYAAYSNIASAITYAANHGVRIVNVSMGGTTSSSTLQSAVNYAWNLGTVVFASSGNGGANAPYYPAGCQNVVSVGATDFSNSWAGFSNYGTFLSLVAPGVNIYTTTAGGGYGYNSGTSFSSPIAAGVGALVLSLSPSMSASSLVVTLEKSTDDLGAPGYDQYYGWGRVNAYKALTSSITLPPPPPAVSITSPTTGASVQGTVSALGSAIASAAISSVQFLMDGTVAATGYSSSFSFP